MYFVLIWYNSPTRWEMQLYLVSLKNAGNHKHHLPSPRYGNKESRKLIIHQSWENYRLLDWNRICCL